MQLRAQNKTSFRREVRGSRIFDVGARYSAGGKSVDTRITIIITFFIFLGRSDSGHRPRRKKHPINRQVDHKCCHAPRYNTAGMDCMIAYRLTHPTMIKQESSLHASYLAHIQSIIALIFQECDNLHLLSPPLPRTEQKPLPEVQYKSQMPSIDDLMAVLTDGSCMPLCECLCFWDDIPASQ